MKSLSLITIALFLVLSSFAQTSPLDPVCTFNYQGVLRDVDDRGVFQEDIRVQFSILDGPGGNELYIEQHETTTDALGLFVLEIGGGTRVGGSMLFEVIPWVIRKHYLKVEIDRAGGNNFLDYGESPFLAVPIAVEAKVAAFAIQTLDTITCYDTLKVKTLCADTIKVTTVCVDSIKAKDICTETMKAEKITVDTICVDGIKINDPVGGDPFPFVNADPLFGGVVAHIDRLEGDVDAGRINADKIQVGDLCATDVNLRNNATGQIETVLETDFLTEDVIAHIDILKGCVNVDTLKAKHIIFDGLGGGGGNDNDSENEIQTISKQGDRISLNRGGGSVTLEDDDNSNELQEISRSGNQITLSRSGGNVTLLDDDPRNELQELFLDDGEIRLTGSDGRIPVGEFSPWTRQGNRIFSESTAVAPALEISESVVIEDHKISIRYPNGSDAIVLDVESGFGPSITFMAPDNDIIGTIRQDGEGGLSIFSNGGKAVSRSTQVPEGPFYGSGILVDGHSTIQLDLPAGLDQNDIHILLTPRSADSKGLALVEKNAAGFTVQELFSGKGSYAFDYTVRFLPKVTTALQSKKVGPDHRSQ